MTAKSSPWKTVVLVLALVGCTVALSLVSNRLWGGRPETLPEPGKLAIEQAMTVQAFGQANGLPNPVLKEVFGLQTRADLQKPITAYGTPEAIRALVIKKMALAAERGSKNWVKIVIKFGLWFAFLIAVFMTARNRKLTPAIRNATLLGAVLVFGIVMGSDPSPMGTVKDAIHLYGSAGAVFPPRMIALTVFLLIVFAVNKYICAWGCQVGVLQDVIFRLNQDDKRKAILGRQFKVPFVYSNGIRVLFLAVFTVIAFAVGADIVEPIDPFKIYKPAYIGLAGGIFLGLLLLASLFIYRPWCHLFCPFGLVGWLVEKLSRVRISVDYHTCIACQKCAAACPSTVMAAILRRDKMTIPDCFSCYTCRDVCPTDSIAFSTRKRTLPPPGHFEKKRAPDSPAPADAGGDKSREG